MQDSRVVWAGVAVVSAAVLLVLFLLINGDDNDAVEATDTGTSITTTTLQDTSSTAEPTSTTTDVPPTTTEDSSSTTAVDSDRKEPTEIRFSFDDDAEGWEWGFADLPTDDEGIYELEAEWRELPPELGKGGGLFSSGQNSSDDLIMYWYTSIEDLAPSTLYLIETVATLGTNVPSGLVGIGGSPSESVWIKAAASSTEPTTEEDDLGFLRLTIDVGAASQDGEDGRVIGTIDNPDVDGEVDRPPYAALLVDGSGLEVIATSDPDGRLWVLVGIDSGFEGLTSVYIDQLDITATPQG